MKNKVILVAVAFVICIMIPVSIAGAIVENPIGFIGELIFGDGDTEEVSNEVKEMYNEFIDSELGSDTLDYINEKLKNRESIYPNADFIIPMLLTLDESVIIKDATFESLSLNKIIDILFEYRYKENDNKENVDISIDEYITSIKKLDQFKKLKNLSNTTIILYINEFGGKYGEEIEINGSSEIGNAIAKSALSKRGCKYVWGAEGPNEFDCSGLVYWACKENKVNFKRTTASVLSTMGKNLSKNQLQPGDIITFKTLPPNVSHVGIYIGNGKMVHAPNENTTVRVDDIFSSKYWVSCIYNYRRLY